MVHGGVAGVLFGDAFVYSFEAGVLGGPFEWSSDMLAAFWFLVFSWPLFLLGYASDWAYRKAGEILAVVLGVGIAGVAATIVFLRLRALAVRRAGGANFGFREKSSLRVNTNERSE